MTDFPESKLDWLIDKYKDFIGWFNASDIRVKGEKKYKNAEWRILMNLAVEKGHAFSSDCYPNAPKDSIAFNLPEIPQFFDECVLHDHYFIYMPEEVFKYMEWSASKDSREYLLERHKWDSIYELLCGLQHRGIIDKQLLEKDSWLSAYELYNKNSSDAFKIHLVNQAKKFSSIYKLVKFGWAEIVQAGYFRSENQTCPFDYNELFLRIIWDTCKYSVLKERNKKPNNLSDRTKLRLAQELEDPSNINIDAALDENIKRLRKFIGEEDDTYFAL
jgi:hypothetical protein